jgi:hypothetical protein
MHFVMRSFNGSTGCWKLAVHTKVSKLPCTFDDEGIARLPVQAVDVLGDDGLELPESSSFLRNL